MGKCFNSYYLSFACYFPTVNFKMIIGSILENRKIEQRISITPEIVKKYKSLGLEVHLTKDYGLHLGITNKDYENEE